VNSKQTKWFTKQGSHGWDYNCNGADDYEYKAVLACGLLCDTSTQAWSAKAGVPGCGDPAQFGVCGGLPCSEAIQGSRPQGCH
jgi:hypothetical protein